MAEREVRYCTTEDGVRIAYSIRGSGPPLLMTPLLLWESFLLEYLSPGYLAFSERLAAGCQLIQYDPRGVGSSSAATTHPDVTALSLDIEAVMRSSGHRTVALFGRATGSGVAMHFAANHPQSVERLVLYAPLTRFTTVISREEVSVIAQMCRVNWATAARLLADFSSRAEFGDKGLPNAEWYRQSTTGEHVAQLAEANADFDSAPFLSGIVCPTLVLQPMNDTRWVAAMGQQIAASIDGATFIPLNGSLHEYGLGDPGPLLSAVIGFVGGGQTDPPAVAPAAFRTILFTDLVGHTEMMSRLGDNRGRDVLREHERITREVLKSNGGTEVKTMGDGFMASFGSVTKAVECAIALQRAFADRNSSAHPEALEGLSVRVGLNAGEPIEEDGDLFGATVILASRIAAKAEGGEILVADTVRGLCSGKGFLFADRGEFVAKGFEEPVRVYEVRWRE